jgi:hypothetical protein
MTDSREGAQENSCGSRELVLRLQPSAVMRYFFLIFLAALLCRAQSITLGAMGGARVTDIVPSPAADESKRYLVGPMIDFGLPLGFSLELDALYSREGFSGASSTPLSTTFASQRANTWEVPLLLKQTLPVPIVKPFVEIGYAARVATGSIHFDNASLAPQNVDAASYGLVVGGGVRIGVGALRLSPQFRYSHWNNLPAGFNFPNGPRLSPNQNQIDVLVGIGWKIR